MKQKKSIKVSSSRSATMKAVKSQDSKIEIEIRKRLFSLGYRYRKNDKKLYGKPDISMKGRKTVIFIDSCFWHGCKKHCRMPNSNKPYWTKKIARNIERDKEVNKFYREIKWKVIRVWEHEFKKIDNLIGKLQKKIN